MLFTMWEKCKSIVILLQILLVSGDYECNSSGNIISCKALEISHFYQNLSVTLTKEESEELLELQIEDSSLPKITNAILDNFRNIQTFRLRNSTTQAVEKGAFRNLANLKKVYLTDNYLEEFNSNAFSPINSLQVLDLSHNLIDNLNNFDIRLFSSLKILNISHNKLEYLAENIVNKVYERNNFYLIVDNNPWNCYHPKWVLYLTGLLAEAFCNNKTYDSSEMEYKIGIAESLKVKNGTASEEDETDKLTCLKYSFKGCLLWAFGAVWIGIIIGNMCKLKRMLFTQPRRYEDKNTQCDYSWKEPFLREEHSKIDSHHKKSSTSRPNVLKV